MNETDFDSALIASALRMAAGKGWRAVTVAGAAREAGLALGEARRRFASRTSILLRFGQLADQAALEGMPEEGTVRDRLFDLLMRRFDAFQAQRDGIRAVLATLPLDPALALTLACATRRSMKWLLEAAGVDTAGPRGELRVQGLVAVWLCGVRAWERDASEDLSGTMAAIDSALQRVERAANWLHLGRAPADGAAPPASEGAGELDPAHPPLGGGALDADVPPKGAGELDPANPPGSGNESTPARESPDEVDRSTSQMPDEPDDHDPTAPPVDG